jgi:flagellar motor switch protein FliM
MQNELTQEQIDAMVQAARSGGRPDATPEGPRVELWDVRRAGQIGREQLQAVTELHEGFARNLTHSLGAYLRTVFTATLVSAEHLSYREFLERIPETTYFAACKLEPMGVDAALQLDLKVAFPIVDLLLGGEGKGAAAREITEIEEQIIESVARIVCRELGRAWQAVNLQVGFESRLEPAEAQRLMSRQDKILSLSFEVTMSEARGSLNLAVPVSISHALLRKISAQWNRRRPRRISEWRDRLKQRLLDCPFPVELAVSGLKAAVSDLSRAEPGDLLRLGGNPREPASLRVAGIEMFHANPARSGEVRVGQVLSRSEAAEAASSPAAEGKRS